MIRRVPNRYIELVDFDTAEFDDTEDVEEFTNGIIEESK